MTFIRRSRIFTIVTPVLLAAACSSPTVPEAGPEDRTRTPTVAQTGIEVRPAASSFSRTPQGSVDVPYVVVNAGSTTVRITTRCGDRLLPTVERLVDRGWSQHSGGACIATLVATPAPLAVGARRDETVVISAAPAGEYRLVIGTEHGPVASGTFAVR
jgi:hypothetical protein